MKPYQVRLQRLKRDSTQPEIITRTVEANDVGGAIAKAAKGWPEAKILGVQLIGTFWGSAVWIDYQVPPVLRLEPQEAECIAEKQEELGL